MTVVCDKHVKAFKKTTKLKKYSFFSSELTFVLYFFFQKFFLINISCINYNYTYNLAEKLMTYETLKTFISHYNLFG